MKRFLSGLGITCALSLCAGAANADQIQIQGDTGNSTENLGDFAGTIEYTFDADDMGTLTISLENTGPFDNGGFITGVVFNIGSTDDDAGAALMSTTNASFLEVTDEPAPPFGTFDAGAALGADWTGGGDPTDGIAVGDSDSFTFKVTADDAMFLSASSFLEGPNKHNFVVRFRGFEDGGSDKVPGVPAPGALSLIALAGLLSSPRRRRP